MACARETIELPVGDPGVHTPHGCKVCHSLTPFVMSSKDSKKCSQCKKSRTKVQEKFARKFPYRFSWLTEPNVEFLKPWEVTKMTTSLRDQLPLQKMLVATRSIPVRGLGAPDCISPSSFSPLPPPSPLSKLWELKILSLRFPRLGAPAPPTGARAARPSAGAS
uniref:uncharacterized protein C3orf22 homolog n=1 Tax=Nyctereutes procyonoides TaxID=34880 RepID=UPI0024451814|nr:uncharacterized protein C3orf22 homolog [Nyctereutes procyonoides]